jgi:hypothetical protein
MDSELFRPSLATELQIENFKAVLRCTICPYIMVKKSVIIFEFTSVAFPASAGNVGRISYMERSVSTSI